MPEKMLIPSIEMRLGALLESSRRKEAEALKKETSKGKPTITLSREFGCEAFPVAERLHALLEKKTGETWHVMDKALLEEVARNHNLSEEMLEGLGEKSGFLDQIFSTFSPGWKTDKDHFTLLARQIISLADKGNVIIVGRGSSILTQSMKDCFHFRLFGSAEFKAGSIARRMKIGADEAMKVVAKKQDVRDRFIRDFLNKDARNPLYYHLLFNNDKNSPERRAHTIMEFVFDQV